MKQFWRVVVFEYRRNVFKKSFILTLLSIPILIAFCIGMGLFIESNRVNPRPVGIVDQAEVLSNPQLTDEYLSEWAAGYSKPVEFITYTAEEEARLALQSKTIQAYFVLPENYPVIRKVNLVYLDKPGTNAERQFFDFLQLNLAAQQPSDVAIRVAQGTEVVVRSQDGSRLAPKDGPTFGLLMPLFITFAFLAMLLMASGYMMTAVADEKENRTMEILISSVSPFQLIGGKIVGIVATSMTMLTAWASIVVIGILVGARIGIPWFTDLAFDQRIVMATIAIALPAYVLAAAMMTIIGSIFSSEKEAQSFSVIFVILHLAPLYISWTFINEPHSTLAVIMSLLPFTSLMTIGMRNLFTIVPAWQVLISVFVQCICAVGGIWLASRVFRLGMLRYGQPVRFARMFKAKS